MARVAGSGAEYPVGRKQYAVRSKNVRALSCLLKNFVTFVLFVVINFLTAKDTKHTKEEAQKKKTYPTEKVFNGKLTG